MNTLHYEQIPENAGYFSLYSNKNMFKYIRAVLCFVRSITGFIRLRPSQGGRKVLDYESQSHVFKSFSAQVFKLLCDDVSQIISLKNNSPRNRILGAIYSL